MIETRLPKCRDYQGKLRLQHSPGEKTPLIHDTLCKVLAETPGVRSWKKNPNDMLFAARFGETPAIIWRVVSKQSPYQKKSRSARST
ncbi:unnamed protein product, partial [Mesorhabditis belari]|uniref:Uncharacterized protein n=1 Tax=Mesorhabditis belari TaxID=2138241 RepID=A0AAF3EHN1_9BILA